MKIVPCFDSGDDKAENVTCKSKQEVENYFTGR